MFEILFMRFYKTNTCRKKRFIRFKKKKNFVNWIKDHGTISFDWRDKPEEIPPSSNDEQFSIGSAIKKIVLFIGLKFKFWLFNV